ncbi:hypothetical protein C9I98_14845 [Photobacterium sanctipauli]|uniref:Uncharacterized protein n=1 Tax=Photobacterium sanctipauli TaxID=1342794 RepID=A0A2T3NR50_9GAMM|nr:hypothetical protein C9I98_14845 [Photobacterium sanctipauli]
MSIFDGAASKKLSGEHLEYAGCIALIIPTNLGGLARYKGECERFFFCIPMRMKIMHESRPYKACAGVVRSFLNLKTMDNYAFETMRH